ncbi:MAG: class I SAM-dependent methyltransferase family protein [Candidatus Nanoarchaeia archaeon]|nr:class I SAM-dependent methyltransferase family protein [Candidatus Nanoarchaeia archaeon]
MNLKELMKGELNENEILLLKRSFDQIGTIAQLEIPKELESKEKLIAEKILKTYKNISTVVKKEDITLGEYRIRPVKILAGKDTTITIHKENGIFMNLDLNKVFFTPRLSGERLRVLALIKKNDFVADLFCGVGPYSILIVKFSKAKKVLANDLNPDAYKYLLDNVKKNKVIDKIECFNKDARDFHKLNADKVIMNIPKFSESFLKMAFDNCRIGGRVFYYCFAKEDELKDRVKEIKQAGNCRILKKTKCGDIGPSTYRWCIDFKKL